MSGPYREAELPARIRWPQRGSWLERLLCRVLGHRWWPLPVPRFHIDAFRHECILEGCPAVCHRCFQVDPGDATDDEVKKALREAVDYMLGRYWYGRKTEEQLETASKECSSRRPSDGR